MPCAYPILVLVFCTFYLWSAYGLIPIMSICFLYKAKFIAGADPELEGKCHRFFFFPSKSEVSHSALWVGESFAIFRNILVKTSNSVVQQNLNSCWKFHPALLYWCSSKMMSLCGHFLINSCQFGGRNSILFKMIACPIEYISHNNNKMPKRNQKDAPVSTDLNFEGNFKIGKLCQWAEQGFLQAVCILFPLLAVHI